MNGFSRSRHLLSSFILIAAVGLASSGIMDVVNEAATPQDSPEIELFSISPSRIVRGQPATLRWRVSNAEHLWISRGAGPVNTDCVKESTGEMEVRPERDTTYRLHAWNRNLHTEQEVTVQVTPSSTGTCKIFGQISRDKREYATTVNLFPAGSNRPLLSTGPDTTGFFGFSGVPAGAYRVVPRGRYPSGRDAIGPIPRFIDVICEPNGTPRADFRIGSTEG